MNSHNHDKRYGIASRLSYGVGVGVLIAWTELVITRLSIETFLLQQWAMASAITLQLALATLTSSVVAALCWPRRLPGILGHPSVGVFTVLLTMNFVFTPDFDLYMAMSVGVLCFAAAKLALQRWVGRWSLRAEALLALAIVALELVALPSLRFSSSASSREMDSPPSVPNVMLVVFDTVRADHTGPYNYERDTTPNLNHLAQEGLVFENAYSTAGWTLPAHASMLTGLLPEQHGCVRTHPQLGPEPTLPERLRERGVTTALFAGNPWLADFTGLSRGFDVVVESWQAFGLVQLSILGRTWAALKPGGADKGGRTTTEAFRQWLGELPSEQPFFALVNLMEAHAPYHIVPDLPGDHFLPPALSADKATDMSVRHFAGRSGWNANPPSSAMTEALVAQYDGGIRYDDQVLGQLMDSLDDAGRLEDTVVIVTSDHGELFGEGERWGHDLGLHHKLTHVPMVLWAQDLKDAGGRRAQPVSLIDIAPTIWSLQAPHDPEVSFPSLGLLEAEAKPERPIYSSIRGIEAPRVREKSRKLGIENPDVFFMRSVQVHGWRLVQSPHYGLQLYNIEKDPSEREELSALHPEWLDQLEVLLNAQKMVEQDPDQVSHPDEQTLEGLRAMGYLD